MILGLLNNLYEGEQSDPAVPGRLAEEVVEALESINEAAGRPKRPSRRRGRGLSGPERKAVEIRAMSAAAEYLDSRGWTDIEDVSASESFDFRASNESSTIKVEVKGTTSAGESVVLTRNEVELHLEDFPTTTR